MLACIVIGGILCMSVRHLGLILACTNCIMISDKCITLRFVINLAILGYFGYLDYLNHDIDQFLLESVELIV